MSLGPGVSAFTESVVEDAALTWLQALGYEVLQGPDIAAGEPAGERADLGHRDVVLEGRLKQALVRLNPDLSAETDEEPDHAIRQIVSKAVAAWSRA